MTNIFTEAFHGFKHWAERRRAELTDIVGDRCNHTIQTGPFAGMICVPWWCWGDGDHLPKLLGTYESELYDIAEQQIAANPDFILNVGCAEGFWGLGMAMRTQVPTVLIDVNPLALEIAETNAGANGLTNVTFSNECTIENIQHRLHAAQNPFLIMDCEGHEEYYLDLAAVPALSKTTILLESHDCFRPGMTDLITIRFGPTHDVMAITQGAKNPYVDVVSDLGDHDKMLMCIEGRPSTMTWLYMVPKAS
jgi:Methyltransferase domain